MISGRFDSIVHSKTFLIDITPAILPIWIPWVTFWDKCDGWYLVVFDSIVHSRTFQIDIAPTILLIWIPWVTFWAKCDEWYPKIQNRYRTCDTANLDPMSDVLTKCCYITDLCGSDRTKRCYITNLYESDRTKRCYITDLCRSARPSVATSRIWPDQVVLHHGSLWIWPDQALLKSPAIIWYIHAVGVIWPQQALAKVNFDLTPADLNNDHC